MEFPQDLVAMAEWSHLFPSRTQKLSIPAVKIAMLAIVKIARCQVIGTSYDVPFFSCCGNEVLYCLLCYNCLCEFNERENGGLDDTKFEKTGT